ncbi:putative LLM family oxidoreductase [Rhodococcus sp. 27YEA15]|uniref:LLM class flavin-dependent oxidoreductase n=1 Tax=Rhodococcus sp. 27YEA15 TaxID=3156259 RepID=UPI003C7BA319
MQLGILSFGDLRLDPVTGARQPVAQQLSETLERIRLADQVGLGFYGLGEHHLDQFAISNPATVLAAAAAITSRITLSSAVTVLSTDDPVRVYQQFATLDQLSGGRAEIIAGRGSFTESFPLFGASLDDYDELYAEKLDLLLQIDRGGVPLNWSGKFRPPLHDAEIYPRAFGDHLRISLGTGGNPGSSVRAGELGLPIVYAIIGGEPERFAPLVDLYRRTAREHDSTPDVTMSGIGLIADKSQDAKDKYYPYWLQTMKYGAKARGWSVPGRAEYDHYTNGARSILTGSPDEIVDRLAPVVELTQPDRYAFQFDWSGVPHSDVMHSIELLGTKVRPQLESAGTTAGARS